MSQLEHLVRQANRIAAFFEAMPGRDEALRNTADHLRKFWAPSLRLAILEFVETQPEGRHHDVALTPLARDAIVQYADTLRPARGAGTERLSPGAAPTAALKDAG